MTSFLIKRFVKNHTEVEKQAVRQSYARLAGLTGIVCNILLFLLKLSAGLLSGSVSVMADAFNNLSDTGSSLVTLIGFKMAGKPADPEHPFGHGRIEYMSGFIVSVLIMLVGVELFKGSFKKIFHPEAIEVSILTVIALVISIGLKFWMSRFNRRLGKAIGSGALEATSRDSLTDCVATAGVLLAVGVSALFQLNIDAYMGVIVSLFILYTGFKTARETLNPLLGSPPDPGLVKELEQRVLSYEGFVGIHDLVVHNYGPGRSFASLHVEVPVGADITRCHEQIDLCEKQVGADLNLTLVIHMDPIVTDDAEVNAVKAQVLEKIRQIDPRLSLHDFRMVKGEKRSNLIFDVVIPPDLKIPHVNLCGCIDDLVKEIDPGYFSVVTIDTDFTYVKG